MLRAIITFLYAVISAFLIYYAGMNIFVYVANVSMGHDESISPSLYYSLGALVFSFLAYLGHFKIMSLANISYLKAVFYIPIFLLLLYGTWAILIVISASGRWN
ncbi:MAG TPA: hypothetical protein PKA63_03630 [Oligoflexia bacterium]|nr:hypothetical protein [Oligoflexia bacterium]HMP47745.1 hypothetical protein [Oligoflexia bacterium]